MSEPSPEVRARYNATEKGKARYRRYGQSAKGKARYIRYDKTTKGQKRAKRYHDTDRYREANKWRVRSSRRLRHIQQVKI